MRAQTSLPALAVALLVLTAVVVLGVAVADGAVSSADRSSLNRQAAVALSDRLVGSESSLTVRENVLDRPAVENLTATKLHTVYGLTDDADAKVTLEGNTIAATGSVGDGATIERLVVVSERHRRTITPAFEGSNAVTLPRRTRRADLTIRPPENVTVSTVAADDRIVLQNDSGLRGDYSVSLSRHRTVRLTFESSARLSRGNVTVAYYPVETRKARLGVTVDG